MALTSNRIIQFAFDIFFLKYYLLSPLFSQHIIFEHFAMCCVNLDNDEAD
jgi:hypothetical protein